MLSTRASYPLALHVRPGEGLGMVRVQADVEGQGPPVDQHLFHLGLDLPDPGPVRFIVLGLAQLHPPFVLLLSVLELRQHDDPIVPGLGRGGGDGLLHVGDGLALLLPLFLGGLHVVGGGIVVPKPHARGHRRAGHEQHQRRRQGDQQLSGQAHEAPGPFLFGLPAGGEAPLHRVVEGFGGVGQGVPHAVFLIFHS